MKSADAFATFSSSALVAQSLWDDGIAVRARYRRAVSAARTGPTPAERAAASGYAAADLKLHRALVEAAAVRLSTAWEMFLHDLLAEYLARRPSSFSRVWKLSRAARLTDQSLDAIVSAANRPFQDLGKARKILREYLGDDLFGSGAHEIDLKPVDQLLLVRHAVVHRAGLATKPFRKTLNTRRDAHSYLLSRPGPRGTIPTTHFERLLASVTAAASSLRARAFQRPRP